MTPPEKLPRDKAALKKNNANEVAQSSAQGGWFFPGIANLLIGGLQAANQEIGDPRKGQTHTGWRLRICAPSKL
jgi:hypothetical protein